MRPLLLVFLLLAVVPIAGCGGNHAASTTTAAPPTAPPTATAPPVTTAPGTTTFPLGPTFTDASDIAACGELERTVETVSTVVGSSTEAITQALHPAQLAKLTGRAQQSLVYSAKVLSLQDAPKPLVASRNQMVAGLRRFAKDFAKAQRLTAQNNIPAAAAVLGDGVALRMIQVSAKHIDDLCGA